ncbi:MAG: phage protein Gp27 family protein [bacterium]
MGKLRKGERIIGRRGFRVDEMSAQVREKILELMNQGVAYKEISRIVAEVYGEKISSAAICRYNRMTKEQFDLAAERMQKTREWSKAIVGAASENPEVDTGKLLTNLIEGDLVSFITSCDMQERLNELPIDKVTDIVYKMGRVSNQREKLLWESRVKQALQKAEEKVRRSAQDKEATGTMTTGAPLAVNQALESQLATLLEHYGPDQIRAGLSSLGVITTRNNQGLDPETLKTIREEIYGIFK